MQAQNDPRPLDQWCETLIERGEFADAILFAKTLFLDDSYKSLILLAKSKYSSGNISGALDEIDSFLEGHFEPKAKLKVLEEKARILSASGRLSEALQALQDAKALNFKTPSLEQSSLDYSIASLLFSMGEYETAQSLFDAYLNFETDKLELTNTSILCGFDRKLKALEKVPSKTDVESKILAETAKANKAKCVYFVSGGLKLCQSFAKHLALHLRNLSGDKVHLHLHGVIAGEADSGGSQAGWKMLQRTLSQLDVPLTFTLRNLNINNLDAHQIETVYACERLEYISTALARYNCPVIVSKLDYLPLYDLSELVSHDYDVALMRNDACAMDIIATVLPSMLIFNPTDESREFAKQLADYIAPFRADTTALLPGLERAALSLLYKLDDLTNFHILPRHMIEFNPNKHHPVTAYRGDAAFIGRGQEQKVSEFADFLEKEAGSFSMPILARIMGTSGHATYAISLLDRYLSEHKKSSIEEKFEIFQLKALLLSHLGNLEEARKFLQKAQRQLPNNEHYEKAKLISLYQLGSVNAALGNFDEAQAVFDKNIEIGCDNGWTTRTGIIDLSQEIKPASEKRIAVSFDMPSTNSATAKYVYFVASDLTYCKKFAPSLIRKLGELASVGCHLHFHGIALSERDVGGRNEDWAFLDKLLTDANISSSFTLGVLDMARLSAKQKKSIYASERFRILPDLLKVYNLPVIVADVDQLPLQDPQCIFRDNVGVQLLRFPNSVLNFLSVTSATVSVFYPQYGGLQFSQKLSAYIENIYSDIERLDWHVDQAALTSVCYTAPEQVEVSYLDPTILEQNPRMTSPDDALNNGAVFWSVTNSIRGNAAALSRLEDNIHFENT